MLSKEKIIDSLKLIKTKLKAHYSDKFDKIILFGSVARGEYKKDSDIDMLVLMNTGHSIDWEEENKIFDDIFEIMISHNLPLDIKYFDKSLMNTIWAKTPFMQNVFDEGIAI